MSESSRTRRKLRTFDRVAARVRDRLAREDPALAARVVAAARVEFERLLPTLPDVGGWRNVFSPIITANGWIIALHRAMQAEGKTAADVVRVCVAVSDDFFRAVGFEVPGR